MSPLQVFFVVIWDQRAENKSKLFRGLQRAVSLLRSGKLFGCQVYLGVNKMQIKVHTSTAVCLSTQVLSFPFDGTQVQVGHWVHACVFNTTRSNTSNITKMHSESHSDALLSLLNRLIGCGSGCGGAAASASLRSSRRSRPGEQQISCQQHPVCVYSAPFCFGISLCFSSPDQFVELEERSEFPIH